MGNKKENKSKDKKRVGIYVETEKWDKLDNYIAGSKSKWIMEQIDRLMETADDVVEMEMRVELLKKKKKDIDAEISILNEKIEHILKKREENSKEFELIDKAMSTLRRVANSNKNAEYPAGYVEKYRVEYVANTNALNYKTLEKQIQQENIPIRDIGIEKGVISPYGNPGFLKSS